MTSARQQKRLELMRNLRRIEKEHKSITNLSSNDPKIKALQSLTKRKKKKRPKYVASELNKLQRIMVEDAICEQIKKGYSVKQISNQMGISQFLVRRTSKKRGIKIRKPFRYKVLNDKGVEIYTHSQESILRYFGWRYHSVENLEENIYTGYTVMACNVLWCDVPKGAKYILNCGGKHEYVLKIK